ncbi:response regulator transcription factor [Cryptosporangium sp. NPDC048952]|uniref:response regulator transcription factor n=1 Tax=Cryptosporangium sp. NPDC048952 TaxID=3363961 RepID=UPI003714708C
MARLLVVEDESDLRELLVQRFEAAGHQVVSVGTGAAALRAVDEDGPPDAAVLDVDLPGKDGVDLLADLRTRFPALPALFITVLWSGELLARMKATGCPYLTKPFAAKDLREALADLLGAVGRDTAVDAPENTAVTRPASG